MSVFSARVVNGQLEIPEGALPEGITVTRPWEGESGTLHAFAWSA
jgi:hypothetical protein